MSANNLPTTCNQWGPSISTTGTGNTFWTWSPVTQGPGTAPYGTWTTISSPHNSTLTTEKIEVNELRIKGLGDIQRLLASLNFLVPPEDLDLKNVTVADAFNTWYQALGQLKQAHQELVALVTLTKNADE